VALRGVLRHLLDQLFLRARAGPEGAALDDVSAGDVFGHFVPSSGIAGFVP